MAASIYFCSKLELIRAFYTAGFTLILCFTAPNLEARPWRRNEIIVIERIGVPVPALDPPACCHTLGRWHTDSFSFFQFTVLTGMQAMHASGHRHTLFMTRIDGN